MIIIKKNGVDLINFDEATVYRTMDAVTGSFSFMSSVGEDGNFPIKANDAVEVAIDDTQIMVGFVEREETNSAPDKHDITIKGRSNLSDLVDSTVGEAKDFTGQVSLVFIAKKVLESIGLPDVEVIDNTGQLGPVEAFDQFDITEAEVGQKGFEFLEPYARKRQVLLNTDSNGNLLLTRASSVKFPFVLKDGENGNIKTASKVIDNSERYSSYTAYSQLNLINLDGSTKPEEAVNQKGLATDSGIRASRIFAFNAEESSDSFTAKQRAIWEANIRRANSLKYTAIVQGHGIKSNIWEPNIIVPVNDTFNRIKQELLLRSVTNKQSTSEGETTILDLTFQSAYTLQAEADRRDALNEDI